MLNQIMMVFGVLCGLVGAAIFVAVLSGPAPKSDDYAVIAGGALLALGIVLTSMSLRAWLTWRRYLKDQPTENAGQVHDLGHPAPAEPFAFRPKFGFRTQERRRSQRVMVQIAVGLRVTMMPQQQPPLLAFTAWVNAHGGLLESPVRIRAGEAITLVIPQSGKEACCRVLQTQKASDQSFAIAFEFDARNPEFWPIASPPSDWNLVSVP